MPQKRISIVFLLCLVAGFSLSANSNVQKLHDSDLDAATIMEIMAQTYSSSSTYRDTGAVSNKTSILGIDIEALSEPIRFSTAFVRPDRFRFEFEYQFSERDWYRYVVHADPTGARTTWDIEPGITEEQSLGLALAGATGVSRGAAHTIPALLIPETVGGWRLTELESLSRIGNGVINGRECLKIRGEHPAGPPVIIWIDPETFLIKRIEERLTLMLFVHNDLTTDYTSEIDIRIDPDELRL